jgi:fused signal recognition particle receptor
MSGEEGEHRGWLKRLFRRRDEAREEVAPAPEVQERPLDIAVERSDEEGRMQGTAGEEDAGAVASVGEEEPSAPPEAEGGDSDAEIALSKGLEKTRSGWISSLDRLFRGKKELDEQLSARLEEILVTADIGVKTAYELLDEVSEGLKRKDLSDPGMVMARLKDVMLSILLRVESPLRIHTDSPPFVIMVVGVNGSGKTTTIAKLAARHTKAGGKVVMVAGDTFRAAAVQQMEVWGARVGCAVVKGKELADPSSVVFEGLDAAVREGADLVLVDTAGRLHTRTPLMEQMKKIVRTLDRKHPGAPHETLLVIDASNGQNAILQARTFHEAVPVTGLALTKLDGTSKGGVLLGMANELRIPVRFVGVGERMEDLREFKAKEFVDALFKTVDVSAKEAEEHP